MKKRCACILVFLAAAAMVSCSRPAKASAGGKLRVMASFDALREMAAAIGGDLVEVGGIVPDGIDLHAFEPKAKDMAALGGARVFVYNGLGLEAWAEKAVKTAGGKSLVVVEASKGAEPIRLEGEESEEKDHEAEGEEHGHGHGGVDPHLWISPKGAVVQARNIEAGLAAADPAHGSEYERNADAFVAELEKLYARYEPRMRAAARREIIAGHAAFGYLCRDFGLEQHSVEDVFASGEPTARQLASLVDFAREKEARTIFAEKLASPAVSETLAREIGAKVRTIYTMASAEDGKSYLERMEANLEAIAASLEE